MNNKIALSVIVSLLLTAIPIYLYFLAVAQLNDDRLFVEAIFFWALGLIFIFAARYANKVYLLNAIHYVFSTFAVIGGKYRTYIYGTGFLVVGLIQMGRWLMADL
jgi:hypothetical protein